MKPPVAIDVTRLTPGPMGTPGRLAAPEVHFDCDTLELNWHQNERGKSCIYADTYKGWVWMSPMLKRPVIRLEDKHGRADVLIHNGNFAADQQDQDGDGVDEVTQIHGCTEVGRGYGDILRKDGRPQWGIKTSGPTLDALIKALADPQEPGDERIKALAGYRQVLVTYAWSLGCEPEGGASA